MERPLLIIIIPPIQLPSVTTQLAQFDSAEAQLCSETIINKLSTNTNTAQMLLLLFNQPTFPELLQVRLGPS